MASFVVFREKQPWFAAICGDLPSPFSTGRRPRLGDLGDFVVQQGESRGGAKKHGVCCRCHEGSGWQWNHSKSFEICKGFNLIGIFRTVFIMGIVESSTASHSRRTASQSVCCQDWKMERRVQSGHLYIRTDDFGHVTCPGKTTLPAPV